MRTHYRFDHAWQLDAAPEAVLALLEDLSGYGAWWPAVRVTGGSLTAGARTADLEVRAPLGYRLRITLAEDAHEAGGEPLPHELRAAISGDLQGWCAWRVEPEGVGTRVAFAQEVQVRQRVLRALSPLLHGALARQHGAVMRSAEAGMRRALGA
ncbi:SRPBCC family protein [Agrococcus jenensis]|uniref:Polyketide cyclase/dehydrase/lipid transport protein n=1 Tax=Agrococcus jenensis TaxID=46353 RepID=A0A3N2AS03_9MICO|nr:SRPBCC family protein [Agrococcus jenensis]ROR65698.1 polyketide cyclase/dehydrase/lipid transport protein [Agrococcus jenensis]